MNTRVQILFDWFAFTVRGFDDPCDVIRQYLRMDPDLFDCANGLNGYVDGLAYNNIRVSFNPRENDYFKNMGISISMSGQGCRTFEAGTGWVSGFMDLLTQIYGDDHVNVTRIDLACDDHCGLLHMSEIFRCVYISDIENEIGVRSKLRKRSIVQESENDCITGETVYIGSHKSDFFIRFYNKAFERGDFSGQIWHRCEMVFKGIQAVELAKILVEFDSVGDVASAVLNDKIAFVNLDDSNITRCMVCDWWREFVDSVKSVHIVARGQSVHTVDKTFEWLQSQAGPSLVVVKKTRFADFLNLLDSAEGRLSSKQRALITDYNRQMRANGTTTEIL